MKNDLTCGIVKDLLPSYADGLTGGETNEAVERHLAGCAACKAAYDSMRAPAPVPETEIVPVPMPPTGIFTRAAYLSS